MKRLKIILQHNFFYAFIIIVSVCVVLFFTKVKIYQSKYELNDNEFVGIVKNISFDEGYVILKVKCKENITGFYYLKTEEERQRIKETISLGDIFYFKGKLIILQG